MTALGRQVEDLAKRIVAAETTGCTQPGDLERAIEQMLSRLEKRLVTVIGPVGFRALLERAAHLTRTTWPWIDTAQIEADAQVVIRRMAKAEDQAMGMVKAGVHIKDLAKVIEREGTAQVTAGASALLAHLIALLCNFIGEQLTFRLLRRVWGRLPEDGTGPDEEGGLGP
jgi:hypothetical protein